LFKRRNKKSIVGQITTNIVDLHDGEPHESWQKLQNPSLGNLLLECALSSNGTSLVIQIIEARDLVALDVHNPSIPYVVVTFGGQKIESISQKYLNPSWKRTIEMNVSKPYPPNIQIEIYDSVKKRVYGRTFY